MNDCSCIILRQAKVSSSGDRGSGVYGQETGADEYQDIEENVEAQIEVNANGANNNQALGGIFVTTGLDSSNRNAKKRILLDIGYQKSIATNEINTRSILCSRDNWSCYDGGCASEGGFCVTTGSPPWHACYCQYLKKEIQRRIGTKKRVSFHNV